MIILGNTIILFMSREAINFLKNNEEERKNRMNERVKQMQEMKLTILSSVITSFYAFLALSLSF